MQMKELQIQHRSDLPENFLRRFWIELGAAFELFLSQCKEHGWLFSVEVPEDEGSSHAMVDAINEGVRNIGVHGGPKLPKPEGELDQDGERCWEFLSCKRIKRKVKDLRGQPRHRRNAEDKTTFVEITTSAAMLAPVDYNVNTITKVLGFKNTLREDPQEPEKFVAIGTWLHVSPSIPPVILFA